MTYIIGSGDPIPLPKLLLFVRNSKGIGLLIGD